MTLTLTTPFRRWLQTTKIIFGLAVFNLAVLCTLDQRLGDIGTLADPWYHPWNYLNEPTLLVFTASLLLIDRICSYLLAIGISGYIALPFVTNDNAWLMDPHFVGSYESQILLALTILGLGLYCLSRSILRVAGDSL